MNNLFIDTDIIFDLLIDRKPFSRDAATLFTLAEENKLKLYTSSLTFSNLYYILRKNETHQQVVQKLSKLLQIVSILKVDEKNIRDAIQSDFKDFEDAIQYYCAIDNKQIAVIITRNAKDYRHSVLPVMDAAGFIKTL